MKSGKQSTLLVVAAVIRKDNKYLIAQRKADSRSAPSKWEFPGGKVEFREDPEAALVRELKEELGITISGLRLFEVTSSVNALGSYYPHVVMITYLAEWTGGDLSLLDCQDVRLASLEELESADLIEGDARIVRALKLRRL